MNSSQQHQPRMIVMALAMATGLAATPVLATVAVDPSKEQPFVAAFDPQVDQSIFGSAMTPTEIGIDALKPLVEYIGPGHYTMLLRYAGYYHPIKSMAVRYDSTNPDRIAMTNVVSVVEEAHKVGIMDIDQYAIDRGLITKIEIDNGGLGAEARLLQLVYQDIMARKAAGELAEKHRFKTSQMVA